MLLSQSVTHAAEQPLQFLRGLRARGYHDYALLYLDELQKRKDLPRDVLTSLPYERAMTLLDSARASHNPSEASRLLGEASAKLDEFTRFYPDHPLSGGARIERGRILLEQARARIAEAGSLETDQNATRAIHREDARAMLKEARRIFETARTLHESALEKYKGYIDPEKEPDRLKERDQAEQDLIVATELLGRCTYDESQTYDAGSEERLKLLAQAADEFHPLYERYRGQYIGELARLWEGKCYEEQGKLTEALGIYKQVIDADRTKIGADLQDLALEFKFICLNKPEKADYGVVIAEATEWIAQNSKRAQSGQGLSIQWQRAIAAEEQGEDQKLSGPDQQQYLRKALADARDINRFSAKLRSASRDMIRRLQTRLGDDGKEPQDFANALEIAQGKIREIGDINNAIPTAAPGADQDKLKSNRELLVDETQRLLKQAIALAGPEVELKQRNHAKYLLAYAMFLDRRSYDAAILAEFLAQHYPAEDPALAQDAAWLAIASYEQAASALPAGQRDLELDLLIEAARLLTSRWPEVDRANRARTTVGDILAQNSRPEDAAEWYSQIPESSPEYLNAAIDAGRAYWDAYVDAAKRPPEERPAAETLAAWQSQAKERLKAGIDRWQTQLTENDVAPGSLAGAKLTLAQISSYEGNYADTLAILTGEPHPVADVIQPAEEGESPGEFSDAQRQRYAVMYHQLLLRAYVGLQQVDQALATMQKLQESAGSGGGDAMTPVYLDLGRELQKEIETLTASGDRERLEKVRSSFREFLKELYSRREKMSFSAMRWVAETYRGLGSTNTDSRAAADDFGFAAQVYEEMLSRDETDASFIPEGEDAILRLRLAECRRRQGKFDQALELLIAFLKQRPRTLEAQFEAARTLQDWGAAGREDSAIRTAEAISGRDADSIWGWSGVANRLQSLAATTNGETRTEHHTKLLEARYSLAQCRRQQALAASADQRRQGLENAKRELQSFVAVTSDIDTEWWSKLDGLYRQIQRDLGEAPKALERNAQIAAAPAPSGTPESAPVAAAAASEQPAQRRTKTNWAAVSIGAGIAILAAAVFGWSMIAPTRRRRPLSPSAARTTTKPAAPTKAKKQ